MRQVLSTALVAVIVGALAGVTAGTLAQAEPGAAVEPAARVRNADRVDGKHAVTYTNKRGLRAGKLVATNARGLLPPNIVQPYWGYIKNKPGILADHQIHWNEVVGKPGAFADGQIGWNEVVGIPGGFADGVDNSIRNTYFDGGKVFTIESATVFGEFEVPSPNILITVEPVTAYRSLSVDYVRIQKTSSGRWMARWLITNHSYASQGNADYRVRFVDFGTGPNGPTAAEVRAARSLEPGTAKKRK